MKKILAGVLLIVMTCLVGCSDGESGGGEYNSKIFDLTEEQEELVTNPTQEYVMAALHQVNSVTGIEADPNVGEGAIDASMEQECVARVYFTSDLVDQSKFEQDASVLEKGTSAGGSIDIYANQDDAIARDEYLHGFDGKLVFDSGSHAVAGTIVIRTSEKLDADSQGKLTEEIVDILTSGDISEEVIETALAEIAQEEQVRLQTIEEAKAAEEAAKAEKEAEKNKIEVGYDSRELIDTRYDDITEMLKEKGFTNIVTSPQEIVFDLEKESKCTKISIDGIENFGKDDRFNPDDEIVICYWSGKTVKVPDSWMNLVELHYEDVEKMFIDAGFTDVTVQPHEIDYDESKVFEGSVVNIEIGNNATFEAADEFYTNVPVRIDYRVKPKSTSEQVQPSEQQPTQQHESTPSDNSEENGNGTSSGGTGVTVPQQEETGANLVWVPTNGGTKYHSKASCSGMKDPIQVSLDTAIANGYTACKRCH